MSDNQLFITSVVIEFGIPLVLIFLLITKKTWRKITTVQLASVTPFIILYFYGFVLDLKNTEPMKMGISVIIVMSFVTYFLSFLVGSSLAISPYPKNLYLRFIVGLISPFIAYGLLEIWQTI